MVRTCVRDDKPRALVSGYRPYTRTNHTLTAYCTFSTLHLVHLWVSDVEHLKVYNCIVENKLDNVV